MRKNRTYDCAPGCPVEAAMDLIGGKWKSVIVYHLLADGTLRFNELQRRLTGITKRMLTRQLRELEADELVSRTVFAQVPPRVEYSLTPDGRSLAPVIAALKAWGDARRAPSPAVGPRRIAARA
ncbi:MAG: helix-turn-helix domain-containing protein [Hyphomicrobiaceae bacterium]|nr:helix-turn-helix domain-containing protein [Hyphomicrobiaceae bacterium]